MSHKKIREEKNCLNCGHIVEDKFCTHCGQENLEIQDSAFHLIIHYIQDIFHYDGKFWHTLKMLILKPGQVPKEYMEGKRNRNLEPLRFYFFASTVFFLLLFYTVKVDKWQVAGEMKHNYQRRLYNLEQEKFFLGNSPDTAYIDLLQKGVKDKLDSIRRAEGDTSIHTNRPGGFSIPISSDTLKSGSLESWLEKRADLKRKELDEKHEGDQKGIISDILSEAFHKLPQLLFLSMPFFAFFLKLLYFRHRRNYVGHFIFSIYFFAYLFVLLSVVVIIRNIYITQPLLLFIIGYISTGLTLYMAAYLLIAMKRFYNDRWGYLIVRYLILFFLFFFVLILLFLLTIFITYIS